MFTEDDIHFTIKQRIAEIKAALKYFPTRNTGYTGRFDVYSEDKKKLMVKIYYIQPNTITYAYLRIILWKGL